MKQIRAQEAIFCASSVDRRGRAGSKSTLDQRSPNEAQLSVGVINCSRAEEFQEKKIVYVRLA